MKAAELAERLFLKAKKAGVKHIVNMSAAGVEADESIPMRRVELLLEGLGVDFTLLRPNWFMQNFTVGLFNGMIRDKGGLFVPAAGAAVSFVDARDIAAVACKVLTEDGHAGKAYTITGGEAFNYEQVAGMLSEVAGKKVVYCAISDEQLKAGLAAEGLPDSASDFMVMLFGGMRAGYNAAVTRDVEAVLGRAPRKFSGFVSEFSDSF